jgi:hypothetical protein
MDPGSQGYVEESSVLGTGMQNAVNGAYAACSEIGGRVDVRSTFSAFAQSPEVDQLNQRALDDVRPALRPTGVVEFDGDIIGDQEGIEQEPVEVVDQRHQISETEPMPITDDKESSSEPRPSPRSEAADIPEFADWLLFSSALGLDTPAADPRPGHVLAE